MNVVTSRMTAEEFLALARQPGKQELLNGELIALPPARQRHNAVARRFYEELQTILDPSRVWHESGYRLESGWLQPDVSVTWPDQKTGEWFEGAPMIAVEVASPGDREEQVEKKIAAYLSEGGGEVWVIRPDDGALAVHTVNGVSRYTARFYSELLSREIDVVSLIAGERS